MENNQQGNEKRNTVQQEAGFSNNQPGQQLPRNNQSENMNADVASENEQHSESSMPQKDNETLGTP